MVRAKATTSDTQHAPREPSWMGCPPHMSDGRFVTDYRGRCATQYHDMADQHMDSYEYRTYLIRNGEKLIESRAAEAFARNGCGPCVGVMPADVTTQVCNLKTCWMEDNSSDPSSIGLGRNYFYESGQGMDPAVAENIYNTDYKNNKAALAQYFESSSTSKKEANGQLDGSGKPRYGRSTVPSGATPMGGC